MSATSMVQEHRQQLIQLRSLADADLRALLAAGAGLDVAGTRDLLISALPELLSPYLAASGQLAAVLFEDLRAEAGRRGVFYADTVAPTVAAARVDATSRWAVAPLANESLTATVETRLSGSVARMIMDASRDTIASNGARESTQFQRMPRPGCCAFCGMLASRPARMAYRSESSAGGSMTYSRDGKSWAGTASHDECHCVIVPVYSGTEMAELASATRKSYEQKYQQSQSDEAGNPLTGAKQVLAEWRRYQGTH